MKNNIKEILQRIEKESGLTILFAIENGSRSWGMASENSDYDVRFVFYRPARDYLSLRQHKDVIIAAYDKDMQPCDVHGSLIDICGFDIGKYLKLLYASNPTTIEWLFSTIVYYGSNDLSLRDHMQRHFCRERLWKHYFSLFKNNYREMIRACKPITYKKYLYSMRGVLNAKYVAEFDAIPPLLLRQTAAKLQSAVSPEVSRKLAEVIAIKSLGMEKDTVLRIEEFDAFFDAETKNEYQNASIEKPDAKVLESFWQSLVLGRAA